MRALVGIVSERDILQLERLQHLGNGFKVEDAMTEDVYTADMDQAVDEVVETMAANKYGSTVVRNLRNAIEGIFTNVDAHARARGDLAARHRMICGVITRATREVRWVRDLRPASHR